MTSSSKDRGSNVREDCQIHVDKEGESCVIKIESVGQEKMLKELLGRFNSLKSEVNQLLSGQQKQQQPKEIIDAIQDMTTKLKPLEDQLQKVNKHVGDDHIQLNKLNTDLNKKFDDIKQDLNNLKDQQKSKDAMEKILQKLDNKPILDAIQVLQTSFDKEKPKPDILARKLDSIDQKLKESQPEHLALIKDIQTKIEPLHKITPQTSETLTKLNDRVKAMHADTTKPHPDIIQKLDNIDQNLKNQQNSLIEPMKQILNEKLDPLIEQQTQTKKAGEEKLGSIERDHNSDSPNRVPLCVNGMIPTLSDPHVLQALAGDIAKKLADIQTKFPSSEEFKRKQDDLMNNLIKQQTPLIDEIKRLTPIIDKLKQQQKDSENFNREFEKSLQPITQKINDLTKQQDLLKNIDSKLNQLTEKPNISKEISTHTQPLQQAVDNLSKQHQPLAETIRDLPKKLDDIRQSQSQSNLIQELSSKLDPLTQSIKAIKDNLDQQTQNKDQTLMNIDKKLDQILITPSDNNQDLEKALQPFSQMIKKLKDSIDQSQIQQQTETKKPDNLEQRLIMDKLNEITTNLKQTDPTIQKLSNDLGTIKTLIEKQPTPDDILSKINEINQKQKAPLDSHSKIEQTSKDSLDIKKKNDDIVNQTDKLIDHLNKVNDQIHHITDQIQSKKLDDLSQNSSLNLIDTLKKFDDHLNQNLPAMDNISKQINSLKDTLKPNENTNNELSHTINDRLKTLDETIKGLSDQISSKSRRLEHDNDKNSTANLRQVPLSQSVSQDSNNFMANASNNQTTNLLTNLLTLQTAIQNSDNIPYQDIQPYLKRIQQTPSVQTDPDLQKLVQRINDLCLNNNNSNTQNSDSYKNSKPNRINPETNIQQYSEIDNLENRRIENKLSLPSEYLTKSRYISFLSNQIIQNNWPKLSQRSMPIIQAIINQPFEFDNGTNLDRLIKQNGLEQYASLTRNAIEKSDKDYDKISYMMDSIVFDKMTMIGSREALIRPWNPSLLNRASSKGFYPYPSGNGSDIERFKVNKDISLWMVETDESKPYTPTEFMPNIERLNEKYEKIQQPQFKEIHQKRREDETRWNERYAFTKDNRTILFVNDLRSYFMDYDTKRKYQVHDGVPINPVCRTGIAGRGDLPFWGPNHCVVVVLLKNINDPEVVLMRHHDNALVLPKGFYGHEARYDNQIKVIQDPVSGQILPPNLLDYWWTNINKLNETNSSINNLKRVLNDKELKEEFAEIFSQKGCNKSVFDNGYVDHPLNTDHAWVETSIWKIQFKDWRIPEMKSAKYAIADDLKTNNLFPFIWMKLTDAILIVPSFDRGILVDVLATGMPL